MVFRNRQKTIRLADVLHGCAPGRIQNVGYMQVIPLVSELSDDRFVSPVEGRGRGVHDQLRNARLPQHRAICVLIVPCHAGYVVKQACPGPRHGARRRGPIDRRAVVQHGDVHPTVTGGAHPARRIPDADPAVRAAGAGPGGAEGHELQQALGRHLACSTTRWESRATVTWNTSSSSSARSWMSLSPSSSAYRGRSAQSFWSTIRWSVSSARRRMPTGRACGHA